MRGSFDNILDTKIKLTRFKQKQKNTKKKRYVKIKDMGLYHATIKRPNEQNNLKLTMCI